MLTTVSVIAFVGVTDLLRARAFYRDTLGLPLRQDESPFALVFDCGGTMLRVTKVEAAAKAPYTVLGWDVRDIESAVRSLSATGLGFLRVPQLPQDALGIWTAPDGTKVAWFKDPDDNLLSLTEFP